MQICDSSNIFAFVVGCGLSVIMAMAESVSDHWQVDKSLLECNRHMLEEEFVFNDVTFKLDYAHAEEQ